MLLWIEKLRINPIFVSVVGIRVRKVLGSTTYFKDPGPNCFPDMINRTNKIMYPSIIFFQYVVPQVYCR